MNNIQTVKRNRVGLVAIATVGVIPVAEFNLKTGEGIVHCFCNRCLRGDHPERHEYRAARPVSWVEKLAKEYPQVAASARRWLRDWSGGSPR